MAAALRIGFCEQISKPTLKPQSRLCHLVLVWATSDVHDHLAIQSKKRLLSEKKLALAHGSYAVADVIFSVAGDLVQLFAILVAGCPRSAARCLVRWKKVSVRPRA
jgi:hypothetical protein